jgi:hypothetical protein
MLESVDATRGRRDATRAMDDDAGARRRFRQLTDAEEREFQREQARYLAAYRVTGEARVLFEAIAHVWGARQTVPAWLVPATAEVAAKPRPGKEAERFRERMRHAKRFQCVRDLRQKHTKGKALDLAVKKLVGSTAGASRTTIEKSYDRVKRSLKKGAASEFFYLVDMADMLLVDLSIDPPDR